MSYVPLASLVAAAVVSGSASLAQQLQMFQALGMQTAGESWFEQSRDRCTEGEVTALHRDTPPPDTDEGLSWSAACYAVAGHTHTARTIISGMPEASRGWATHKVFEVGQPASASEAVAALPTMQLVLEFQPHHTMALFHAGMAELQVGQLQDGRRHLASFLAIYTVDDDWRHRAAGALQGS